MKDTKMKMIYKTGFWSALLMAIINLWFYAAFLPYSSIWQAGWPGIESYAASFESGPFLAWVVPAFLLPPAILIMMVSIHLTAPEGKRIWSLTGLIFAAAYMTVVTPFYYIQMTVVPFHLAQGTTDGLPLWIFAYHYPHNIFGAIEGIGYGFLAASVIFAGLVFQNGRLRLWVRWTFVVLGISVCALFINPIITLPFVLGMSCGISGLVSGILAPVLLAILFRKSELNNKDLQ